MMAAINIFHLLSFSIQDRAELQFGTDSQHRKVKKQQLSNANVDLLIFSNVLTRYKLKFP